MSKRERSWRDSRKTKKQKTTHSPITPPSSIITQILPKLIHDNPGSSSSHISEIISTRIEKGEWGKNVISPPDMLTSVKIELTNLHLKGETRRFTNKDGVHFYYSLSVEDQSMWEYIREIIQNTPGVTRTGIVDKIMEANDEGKFSMSDVKRRGKDDRRKLRCTVSGMLEYRVKKKRIVRTGIGDLDHPFRYFLDIKEVTGDTINLNDCIVHKKKRGYTKTLWGYVKEIIENEPGSSVTEITNKLMERVQKGEFQVKDLTSKSQMKSDRNNLRSSVSGCLGNRVRSLANIHQLTRTGTRGQKDPYRYYIGQDRIEKDLIQFKPLEIAVVDEEIGDVSVEEDEIRDEDELSSSPFLGDLILEILNSKKTVKQVTDQIINSGKLEKYRIHISDSSKSYVVFLRNVAEKLDEMFVEGILQRTEEDYRSPYMYSLKKEEVKRIVVEETEDEESLFREQLSHEFSKIIEIVSRADSKSEKREYRGQFLENLQKWGEDVHEKITGNTVFELY